MWPASRSSPENGGDPERAAEADVPRKGAHRSGPARKYIKLVKTGIPGVTWVKLDPAAEWPEALQLKKREL